MGDACFFFFFFKGGWGVVVVRGIGNLPNSAFLLLKKSPLV